ncbi:MAG: hypothetical protein HFJ48_05640 [Clostridia bacterium]|nr:hypothetical protein [Clostridia bacterium]
MADQMEDLFANVKKMVDSGNIPPEVQQMMNNLQNSTSNSSSNNSNSNSSSNNNSSNNNSNGNNSELDLNNILSQVSPEMLNSLSSMLQSNNSNNNNSSGNNSTNNSSNSSGFNIDMNTMLKMKNIISSMNQKDDPRANLLYSLKPYLRDSKKGKLDQYVNLLNMTKIADIMKNDNKENNNHA